MKPRIVVCGASGTQGRAVRRRPARGQHAPPSALMWLFAREFYTMRRAFEHPRLRGRRPLGLAIEF